MIKKILVVAESLLIDESSGAKANVALIKNLKSAGFEVQVDHYSRENIQLDGIACISIKENRRSFYFIFSRIERFIRYKTKIKLNRIIEGSFGFSFTHLNDRNSISAHLRENVAFQPDLVLTLSQGASFRPHHALLKVSKFHEKWLAYVHDPYPMHSYPRPYDWVEPGHQKKRQFFLNVARKAKYAVYPSLLLAEWMESYYKPLQGKRLIIPHQIDGSIEVYKELDSTMDSSKFNLLHAGTLLEARNPLYLIDAFEKFLERNPEAREECQLIFLGPRSKYNIQIQAKQKKIPQIHISEGYLNFEKVFSLMNATSVNIIIEANGPISPFLPGKFSHCIQTGKPILLLGPKQSEVRRLLGSDFPYWSEINNRNRICTLIEELYKNWKKFDSKMLRPDLLEYMSPAYLKVVVDSTFE